MQLKRTICHLSSCHPPFDVRIFHKECGSLAQAGYKVNFVVPNKKNDVVKSVQICGIPTARNRIDRFLFGGVRVLRAALKTRSEVFHFHDPDLIPVGLLLKAMGKVVIYDVHEDVPKDILDKDYLPYFSRRLISSVAGIVEKLSARIFDGVVAATPSIARNFPLKKTITLQNFPQLTDFTSTEVMPYDRRPYVVAYVGGIGEHRGLREMIAAVDLMNQKVPTKLVIAGTFDDEEAQRNAATLPGWKYVEHRGWQSRKQVADLLQQEARVGLVTFHPIANHVEAQPNKLFEYMAAGLPVIMSNFPAWNELLMNVDTGISVDPMDPVKIAEAIEWIFQNPKRAEEMGRNGLDAIHSVYNWDFEVNKLLGLYKKLEH